MHPQFPTDHVDEVRPPRGTPVKKTGRIHPRFDPPNARTAWKARSEEIHVCGLSLDDGKSIDL
jgi:hypothetical protein